ncbi:MAG: aminotransferase class III-fold pyridoxal phosphate-dependent enzyme, partial [Chloroflexi bacterium]|nr:aminotransferase class III-fold pyridoxal phosphate-dependent enzyme [Chloroflexota bacterium]
DVLGAQGACSLGFNNERVAQAMIEQIGKISTHGSGWPAVRPAVELAAKIASLTPEGLTKSFFGLSGSDANETAIKIARQYHKIRGKAGKFKVVTRWGGYHGSTLATSAASGYTWRRQPYEPLPGGFVHVTRPYCFRCPYRMTYPDCGIECAREFRRVVEYEDPSTVACYVGELTLAGGGILTPPPEYPRMIRQTCDEYDILMITDEVVTGFCRTGTWFESEQFDVTPDIINMGKAITGGFAPLSATHVKREIADVFAGRSENLFQHGFTFGGNPLSCAAALANIEVMEEMDMPRQVREKSAFLAAGLEKIRQESRVIGDIRVRGLMIGVELVRDPATKELFPDSNALVQLVKAGGKKRGMNFFILGPVLMIQPPLIITYDEMQSVLDVTAEVVKEVEGRFL